MAQNKGTYLHGHRYGQGTLFKRNPNEFIVWIPKNASCTIRKRFLQDLDTWEDYEIDNYIIFLRDPITRWISGFIEYLAPRYDIFCQKQKHINFDRIEFDEHTTPQYKFLPNDYLGKSKFYNIDNGGLHLFNNEYKIWDTGIPKMNRTSSDPRKKMIHKDMTSIRIPTERIIEYYSMDYKLLEACGH